MEFELQPGLNLKPLLLLSILSITHGQPSSNNRIVRYLNASAFSASSELLENLGGWAPEKARYNSMAAWCPTSADRDERPYPWLQIDLGECYTITDVGTKGDTADQFWVTDYLLSYSPDDPNNLSFYNGIPGALIGNAYPPNWEVLGVNSTMNHPSFTARYVRFTPIAWHGSPPMRVELYGFATDCTPPLEPCLCSDGSTLGEAITYETDCSNTATGNGTMCDICTVTQCQCPDDICTNMPSQTPTNNPTDSSKTPTLSTTSPTLQPIVDSSDSKDSSDSNDISGANMVDNNEINNDGLSEKWIKDQINIKINFNNLTMIYVWIIVAVISTCIVVACWLLRSRNSNRKIDF